MLKQNFATVLANHTSKQPLLNTKKQSLVMESYTYPIVVCSILLFIAIPKVKYLFESYPSLWDERYLTWLQSCSFMGLRDFATFWTSYEIHGLDRLRSYGGNCLLVGYHSRCTIDLVYVMCFVEANAIATHLMFKIPVLGWLLRQVNIIPSGSGGKAEQGFVETLARSKRPVMLLPGGVYECLKPLSQIGKLQWKDVPGFARIVHKEQQVLGSNTKIVPFYTKNCEKAMYRSDFVYEYFGNLSTYMYTNFKRGHIYIMPLMLTCMLISVGCKIVPRPTKLDTYVGEPVILREGETAQEFSHRIAAATQQLIIDVEALPQRDTKMMRVLKQKNCDWKKMMMFSKVVIVGTYTILQNVIVLIALFALIWSPVMALFYARHLYYTAV